MARRRTSQRDDHTRTVAAVAGPDGFPLRFLSEARASTAVEFALVLLPFVALLLANIETAVMMFTSSVVQGGITNAARLVRTGQVSSATTGSCPSSGQAASIPAAFSNAVCNGVFGQVSCGNLTFDVRSFANFASANTNWAPSFDVNGQPTNNCFDTGGSSAIVAIRVAYSYSFITPGLSTLLGAGASQTVPFVYTVILQNEGF